METAVQVRVRGKQWFADSVYGNDAYSGKSYRNPKKTIQAAVTAAGSRDTIHLFGEFTEPVVIPLATSFLSFIGEGPYQRAAQWGGSAVGQTLCTVNPKGCRFENIYFRVPGTAGKGIHLVGDGVNDARYAEIRDCRFHGDVVDCYYGIQADDGVDNVLVENCVFTYLNAATHGTGIYAVGSANQAPGLWRVKNCVFVNNLRHVYGDFRSSIFTGNIFLAVGINAPPGYGELTATTKLNVNVGGYGNYNCVHGNQMGGDYSITGGYKAGASDQWEGNDSSDVAETEVGAEARTLSIPTT